MGLGRLIYITRNKYGRGFRVAYYRDLVRPRILNTVPLQNLTDGRCEVHALTSDEDWLNLMWTLKSFYWMSGRRYKLCIHDDGTLGETALGALKHHFPDARLILRSKANAEIAAMLARYRRCLDFRMTNALSAKIFDCLFYLDGDRLLLFDSDLLFFRPPQEYVRRAEDPQYRVNSFNPQNGAPYTLATEELSSALGYEVYPGINSGLGLIHRGSLDLDMIEKILSIDGIHSIPWRVEQTVLACLSSRWGVELLPEEYFVRLDKGLHEGQPFRHYVGPIRHLMYSEGMRHLARQRFLE